MFNRLKIKLTLTNLLLLSAVLFIIFSGLYFIMKGGMQRQSEILMKRVAAEERLAPPMDIPDAPPPISECFFVKTDKAGKTFEFSPNIPVSEEAAANLAAGVLDEADSQSHISYKSYAFSYLKVPKSYGHMVVFLDTSAENEVLNRLIVTSILVGTVSLFLVLLISLYLSSRAIIPIRNSWEKQNAFVADASHELRTPLAVINSNLEIVLDNNDESVESQSKWLRNIQGELSRMTRLVDDLLFLARADMDEERIPVSPFDLSTALKKSISAFEPFALNKGIQLLWDIEPDIIVSGNEGRIKQLAAILLDNATKHTPREGRIELKAYSGENTVEIIVSDTGEGIPKEHLGKIFERFYRVEKSRSRNQGGSGLGLSIAKCIVKEHKGSIHVASTVGKGTEFRITLPLS